MLQKSLQPLKSWQFVYLKEVTSTNTYVKDNCANTNPRQKVVVFTDHQTEGRGQYGSTWSSSVGKNLLMSIYQPLESKSLDPLFPFKWNMYIAVIVRQVIQQLVEKKVSIKWPNDIIINDKKVGGILIQNLYSGSQIQSSIIGIGINVNQETFDDSLPYATSLKRQGTKNYDRQDILYQIINLLDGHSLNEAQTKNPHLILNMYNKHLYKVKENVTCRDKDGAQIEGILSHIDKNGDLNLKHDGALLRLAHGNYKLILN